MLAGVGTPPLARRRRWCPVTMVQEPVQARVSGPAWAQSG